MKGKFLILEKISDDKFKGNHPNGINVGNTEVRGINCDGIEIEKPLVLYSDVGSVFSYTSKVISFDEKNNILKTENSTYKIYVKD